MAKTIPTKLIPSRLLGYGYYIDLLTLLLKNSYGVPQQTTLFVDIINNFNDTEVNIFNLLGKYNENGTWQLNIDGIDELDENDSDLLDKIASIVGASRYYPFIDGKLNNRELFILICMQIVRNNYDGTRYWLDETYSLVNDITGVSIKYYTDDSEQATCNLILDTSTISEGGEIKPEYENIVKLFDNGYLTIRSLGIKYNLQELNLGNNGYFDAYPISEGVYDPSTDHTKWNRASWN